MPYTRRNWQNAPSSATPVNAAALNNIEDGVEAATEAIANLPATYVAVPSGIADGEVPTWDADTETWVRGTGGGGSVTADVVRSIIVVTGLEERPEGCDVVLWVDEFTVGPSLALPSDVVVTP